MSNTRAVTIHKDNTQAPPFVSLSTASIVNAYQKLHDAEAFYLYLYLCGNKDGYTMKFSAETLSYKCGQSANLIEENLNKLIKAGFLIQQDSDKDVNDFYASVKTPMITWG